MSCEGTSARHLQREAIAVSELDHYKERCSQLAVELERLRIENAYLKDESPALGAENIRLKEDLTTVGDAFATLYSQAINGVICDPAWEPVEHVAGRAGYRTERACLSCSRAWRTGREVLERYDDEYASVSRSRMFMPKFHAAKLGVDSDE